MEFEKIAESNDLSTSEWTNIILKNNKNKYGKQDDNTALKETLKDTIDVIEEIMGKVKERIENTSRFLDGHVNLILLNQELFMSLMKLNTINNKFVKNKETE